MITGYQKTAATGAGARPRSKSSLRRRLLQIALAMPCLALAALVGGFLWFAFHVASKETRLDEMADGIVALTGGASRIPDAVELLASGRGQRLLITGVSPSTNPAELARLVPERQHWFGCCVDLDYSAINTIGNAVETRRWALIAAFIHSLSLRRAITCRAPCWRSATVSPASR